jgi:two-component system CheB/CheR fusion protein
MSRTKKRPSATASLPLGSPGTAQDQRPEDGSFPVVGIGASAGGLEAFTQLLAHLPDNTGMAFVLIQHLDPNHESQLADLLSKATRLPVIEVADGMAVSPDHIYVIPPATNLTIVRGVLQLSPRGEARIQHLPLDVFFRSVAEDRQSRAIGVILSGTGSDGSLGLAEIKAVGGITFAQDDKSARYPDMPLNAISGGCIDFVLPPDEIAGELVRIGRHAYLDPVQTPHGEAGTEGNGSESLGTEEDFKRIIGRLRSGTGVDFSRYRDATLRRRMARRMAINRTDTLAEYMQLLEHSPPEVEALYQDILINVTSFFRDSEVFETLKSTVFPEIIKNKSPEAPIRIWVPGCSTGQEVYSLAIALLEFLDQSPMRPPIQLFGTDINDAVSVEKARVGLYPHSIESEISPERLRRHFTREDHGYRIGKSIRDMCVFARQNVAADPPFSRLDLISCRNLLIYLSAPLQKRVIPTFHYALNPGGYLLLGTAEAVGSFADLFSTVDKHHSIYRKTSTVARPYPYFASDDYQSKAPAAVGSGGGRPAQAADMQKEADRLVLGRYAPPGVLIDEDLEVLQFRGQTGPYLVQPAGLPTHNILRMARDTLFLELRSAIEEAKRQNAPVRRSGVRLRDEHQTLEINLEVIPIRPAGSAHRCLLVLFEEVGGAAAWDASTSPSGAPQAAIMAPVDDSEVERLRRELASAKEYMQANLEQQSAFNEELRSANEEILSSNEELQSTNEELQTAKEELQSTNEELRTVNDELQSRNQEVSRVNDDLTNTLASGKIPIVMLGRDLRIRRFTPAAGSLLNLIPTDVGRPLSDIRPIFEIPNLEAMLLEVIADVAVREQELRDRNGHWYLLRVHPYRTADNRIDGAVLALMDIDERQRAQEASQRLAAIVESSEDAIVGATLLDGTITSWNAGAERIFGYTAAEVAGKPISVFLPPDRPEEMAQILEKLEAGERVEQFETVRICKHGRRIDVSLTASPIKDQAGRMIGIAKILRDISRRKQDELKLAEQARELARSNADLEQFASVVSHDLRAPLSTLSGCSQLLIQETEGLGEEARELVGYIQQSAQHMTRLVERLLHYSRVGHGNLERMHCSLEKILSGVLRDLLAVLEASGGRVTHDSLPEIEADPALLAQLLQNLIENAIKYRAEAPPRIHIFAHKQQAEWVISVADNGIGIDSKHFGNLFQIFQRLHSDESKYSGIGIGLATCKRIVEKHGGHIWVESQPGQGSTFSFSLPR